MWLPSPTPENARPVSGAQAAAVPPGPSVLGRVRAVRGAASRGPGATVHPARFGSAHSCLPQRVQWTRPRSTLQAGGALRSSGCLSVTFGGGLGSAAARWVHSNVRTTYCGHYRFQP